MHRLALSYEGLEIPASVLERVDVLELTPETIAHAVDGRPTLVRDHVRRLREINAQVPLTIHGVSLSIGSADAWNDAYIRLLDECFNAFPHILWHSEHLGFTRVNGSELCTMLPIPYTLESLDLVSARAASMRARYGCPFLLEPVVNLLPPPPGELVEADYLNRLAEASGCGLILDAYNLLCDRRNHTRDVTTLIASIEPPLIRELHIAGGVVMDGVQLDVHTTAPEPDTLDLATTILGRADHHDVLVTFELLREGYEVMGDQLLEAVLDVRQWLKGIHDDAGQLSVRH